MANLDAGASAAVALALGQTVTSYSVFLPPISEVRRASKEDSLIRGDVRMGQFAAAVVSLSVAYILTNLTGSFAPFVATAMVAVVIAGVYETALRGERMFENAR